MTTTRTLSLTALDAGPYELRQPVPVEVREVRFPRETGILFLALWPEADLEGTGQTKEEALSRLGRQAAALYQMAERRPDAQLGPVLRAVKTALAPVVRRRGLG